MVQSLAYSDCTKFKLAVDLLWLVGAAAASDNWPPPRSNVPSPFGALEFVWFS
jgi:hypothetical protein